MQSLYLIRCQEFYKIGVANDVENRLAQLSTGNPYPLIVEIIYHFDNAEIVEKSLHQKFKKNRVRGEWFQLSYDEKVELHKICLMLGGSAFEYRGQSVTEDVIQEAEEIAVPDNGGKWDYAAMFLDGWRMEAGSPSGKNEKYWGWRKRTKEDNGYIYGGRISDLPYPIEEMRVRYGKQE